MADIFLSYAREDLEKAERLARALEAQGWSVWWDLTVPPGVTWDEYIGGKLKEARSVIVAWSAAAVRSEWVREEARYGKSKRVLVPVLLEDIEAPFGFGGIQAVDLAAWTGDPEAAAFKRLAEGIERILGPVPASVEGAQRQRDLETARAPQAQEEEYRRAEEQARRAEEKKRGQELKSRPIRGVMRALLQILLNGLGVLLAAYLVPGVEYPGSPANLLLVGLVIGLINLLVKPLVTLLSLPAPILTLGLFYLVVNSTLFFLAAYLPGVLLVEGCLPTILGGLVLAALNWLVGARPGDA